MQRGTWSTWLDLQTTALAGLALAVTVLFVVRSRPRPSGLGAQLQMPPGAHWLWGHEKAAAYDEPAGVFYDRWFSAYGPAFVMRGALGFGDILALADPEALAHVFIRRSYDYVKAPTISLLTEHLVGKSLVWVEDPDEHARMRRLMSPCFTAEQVKDNSDKIISVTQRFVNKLKAHVEAERINGAATVDLQQWMWRVTLDVIGQVGFNHDFECGESNDAKNIGKAWHSLAKVGMSFKGYLAMLVIRRFFWIPGVGNIFDTVEGPGEVKRVVERIGKELIHRGASVDNPGHDLLSILIQEEAKASESERDTDKQLLAHICTFVVAGSETVSSALKYTLWELAKNPAVQDKLRADVLEFDGPPTYEDFQTPTLQYLDAVTKEALRLYTPASYTERVALKDDTIPLRLPVRDKDGKLVNAIHIKTGQLLIIPSISAQRLDCVWGDGHVFRPERWLLPNSLPPDDILHKGWGKTFSFLQGPRSCIGTRLAVYEYKTVLTALVRNFVFHDTGNSIESLFVGTLEPRVIGREAAGPEIPCRISLNQHSAL